MNLFSSFIFKDYRILKICFMALTSYLLIEEMIVFLVIKPTLTSLTQTNIKPETFPEILICPEPAFDLDALTRYGYRLNLYYSLGISDVNRLLIGWLGNQTDINVNKVADDISKIKTIADCPQLVAKFEIDGNLVDIPVRFNLTKVKFPTGRCCRALRPQEAETYDINYIYLHHYFSNFTNFTDAFNAYISDTKSATFFEPQKFAIEGPKLNCFIRRPGWIDYKVKVLEEIHLEDDPHFPCRNYEYDGEYNECLEEEYTRQSLQLLNCTPPWMTDNQDIWCKHQIKVSEEMSNRAWFLLGYKNSYFTNDEFLL